MFAESSDGIHPDQIEDRIHILLSRFNQPPPYVQFTVVFTNPLIGLLKRLPDTQLSYSTNYLVLDHTSHLIVEFMNEEVNLGHLSNLHVNALKSLGRENVYDEDVCKGLELKYGVHFTVDECSLQDVFAENQIAEQISKDLFPASITLTFKFNKLVIYEEEGGHFLEHCDTAYAANHKETLLISIPSKHNGVKTIRR